MNWRVVVITKRCKLEYKLNYLIVRGETTTKIFLPEIAVIMIQSTTVAITAVLLSEIIKNKINLIFCDEKHNPQSQLLALYGSFDNSKKIKQQISWNNDLVGAVWTIIVREKIRNQKKLLKKHNIVEYKNLEGYLHELEYKDVTNREGHAAKVYFNALFGKSFSRDKEVVTNSILNYGYSILLSAFNREIVANGYLTQIGLHHENQFNKFNLSSDLMEPFRPIIDEFCYKYNTKKEFGSDIKHKIIDLLNKTVYIDGKKQVLKNAISIYCKSVFKALNENKVSLLKFYEL